MGGSNIVAVGMLAVEDDTSLEWLFRTLLAQNPAMSNVQCSGVHVRQGLEGKIERVESRLSKCNFTPLSVSHPAFFQT